MTRHRSTFGTLEDRVIDDPPATSTPAEPRPVLVLIDGSRPGLLARWHRAPDGDWEGLVAVVGGPDDFVALWVPASRLTQALGS